MNHIKMIYIWLYSTTAACSPGSYLNITENKCYTCEYGTYQPERWQTQCLTCGGDNFTTEYLGSDSQSLCRCECFSFSLTFSFKISKCFT